MNKPESSNGFPVYLCYSIGSDGGVAFEYAHVDDSIMLQEFRKEMPLNTTICITTDKEEYMSDDAYADVCQHIQATILDMVKHLFPQGTTPAVMLAALAQANNVHPFTPPVLPLSIIPH